MNKALLDTDILSEIGKGIAAVAITCGLGLVTGNTAHYRRLLPLGYSLNLINWRIWLPVLYPGYFPLALRIGHIPEDP